MTGDTGLDSVDDVVERAKRDPAFFHALVFDPDKAANQISDRRLKSVVFGIDPDRLLVDVLGGVAECGPTCAANTGCNTTCGDDSCNRTCGNNSCTETCQSSCNLTCGNNSCNDTTKLVGRFEPPVRTGGLSGDDFQRLRADIEKLLQRDG
jgi:hypothetical protein